MNNETRACCDCHEQVSCWSLNGYDRCTPCQLALDKRRAADIAARQPAIVLNPGDRIAIHARGRRYTGIVQTAENWGRSDGWYIQFTHDAESAGNRGEPGYWKQGCDGGIVEKVEVRPLHEEDNFGGQG